MIIEKVVAGLSDDLAEALGFDNNEVTPREIIRRYIQRALVVGIDHYRPEMEEIVAMNLSGFELGRYRSVMEAERKTGIHHRSIQNVMAGNQHSAGGMIFIKAKNHDIQISKTA